MAILQSVIGFAAILAFAWVFSENRRSFPWRAAGVGLALQFALAWVLIEAAWARGLFLWLNRAVGALQEATGAGTQVVFGYLGGGALPYAETATGTSFILAFQALPLVLVISALSALLWHWRVLPWVVAGFAWVLRRSFKIGGGLGLGAAANIFVGMVEAPLLIRPVLARLPRADLFVLMTCGMATVAGTVMVIYAAILAQVLSDPIGHILTASVISVPAAILIARIMIPAEVSLDSPIQDESLAALTKSPHAGAMDAITKGTQDGLALLLNIIAMLIVLVALVALVNAGLSLLPDWGGAPVTLERLLGLILRPYAWALGVPWAETAQAGALIGSKTILNEFVAFLQMAALPADALSERTRLILLYALCGFANPGSVGIMIGGLSAMVPERRGEIVSLGLRSLVAGTLATGMTGAVVGVIALAP